MPDNPDILALVERLRRVPNAIACDTRKDQRLARRLAVGFSPLTPKATMVGPVWKIGLLAGRPKLHRPSPPANFFVIDAFCPGEVLLLCADRDEAGFLTLELVQLLSTLHQAAIACDAFSRRLLLMGLALTEAFSLPPCPASCMDDFRVDGAVSPAPAMGRALAEAAAS